MTVYVGSNKVKDIGSTGVYLGSQNTNCLTKTPKNINLEMVYGAWTRPNLTADGTLGGDSFAVAAESTWSGYPVHQAVDGDATTRWLAAKNSKNSSFIFYNPTPLKVTKIVVTKQHTDSGVYASAGDVYGSHDNSSWHKLASFTGGTYNNGFTCDLSSNTVGYKYYKITPTATTSAGWGICDLQITATAQNTLVLKKGSKVYVPNGKNADGSNKFDEVVIESDLSTRYTYAPSTNSPCVLFVNKSGTGFTSFSLLTACVSGTTRPSGNHINWPLNWYDTNNNIIETIADNTTLETGLSLPFAIITQGSDGNTISIDQTFDWCGYIGSTAFVLPGVKGLIPNGWNSDGTYKNIEFETGGVLTYNYTGTDSSSRYTTLNANSYNIPPKTLYEYDKTNNLNLFDGSKASDMISGELTLSSGVITSLTPYTAQPLTTVIPIKEIYNGSQLVYQIAAFVEPTVLYNNGNIGAVTWTQQCPKGIYQLSLAGGGGGASSGYYYWPAGNRGAVLVCTFELEQPSLISVSIGAGTSGLGGRGGDTVFSINGKTAVTCPGNGGTITIDNSAINILSTTTNNTGGGGGGSGSNPTPLSPWGDGGYTHSGAGRGGGMRLEWLRLK